MTMTPSKAVTFDLDATKLVFQNNEDRLKVVPVTLKSIHPITVDILIEYCRVKDEVSELILSTLSIHNHHPLSSQTLFVGKTYSLLATRKDWRYGKFWKFRWGEDVVQPSKEKWRFEFIVNDDNTS
ncbi:hypothetical protein FRC02_012353 [Tulasnella sp. 418]|nr:hypothetical protein FRC02_012353 [Tulasnella sp. 418]